jgi:RimJ/RimL family protein N-acetyltransferase
MITAEFMITTEVMGSSYVDGIRPASCQGEQVSDDRRFPGPAPVRLNGEGLVLREWRQDDVARMTDLFDDPQVRRWTPLASPFDQAAARAYHDRAQVRRADGSALQLAVTQGDGSPPLGEVLLFMHPDVAEVGWALGPDHRGQRVASRAVRVLLAWAGSVWGVVRFRALIEPGNVASERVAVACGFAVVAGAPVMVESRGRTVGLTAWELALAPGIRLAVASEAPRSG